MQYITYNELLNQRSAFRKAGGTSPTQFNIADNPAHKFFKIFFHFYNGTSDNADMAEYTSGGLLSPIIPKENDEELYRSINSALSYLKINGEDERAEYLDYFIKLLSNISSETPWYFKSIEGLDAVMERKHVSDKDFKFEEERPKITIKCIRDAVDDRIGTLLDLYRAIIYSQVHKRFVVPSNLRKFDMSILIFESPIKTLHKNAVLSTDLENESLSTYNPSYKYIEFHNCEINYSSSKTGYATIDNENGWSPEYTIDIEFDDMYESRYNEFMAKYIGDFVTLDLSLKQAELQASQASQTAALKKEKPEIVIPLTAEEKALEKLTDRINEYDAGFMDRMVDQLSNSVGNFVEGKLNKVLLGNLYKLSLTDITSGAQSLASGDVLGTAGQLRQQVTNEIVKTREWVDQFRKMGNLYVDSEPTALDKMHDLKNKIKEGVQVFHGGDLTRIDPREVYNYAKAKKNKKNGEQLGNIVEDQSGLPGQVTNLNYTNYDQNTPIERDLGDLFEDGVQPRNESLEYSNISYNIYDRKITKRIEELGNMYKQQSAANNI